MARPGRNAKPERLPNEAGVKYDTLWSEDFTDAYFLDRLKAWLNGGRVVHDASHVKPLHSCSVPDSAERVGRAVVEQLAEKISNPRRL